MMKLVLLCVLFPFAAMAEVFTTRIHSVDLSPDPALAHFVRFENGRVGFIEAREKAFARQLKIGSNVRVELDEEGNLHGLQSRPGPAPLPAVVLEKGEEDYLPTDLSSMEEARTIFLGMNRHHQWRSQCYNRAHVWTYEAFTRSGLKSMKLFMFFTRSYIRRYRYKWWFHVTPMTYVDGVPVTLDRTFMKGPALVKTWTDQFIYSKRECPVIHRYSDYRDHQEEEHCYLHPASMYFWQPRDLENFENTGAEKKQYVRSEVNWAYREAF